MENASQHTVGTSALITKSTMAMNPIERPQAAPLMAMIAIQHELVSI